MFEPYANGSVFTVEAVFLQNLQVSVQECKLLAYYDSSELTASLGCD